MCGKTTDLVRTADDTRARLEVEPPKTDGIAENILGEVLSCDLGLQEGPLPHD